jgi:hypothetical protein
MQLLSGWSVHISYFLSLSHSLSLPPRPDTAMVCFLMLRIFQPKIPIIIYETWMASKQLGLNIRNFSIAVDPNASESFEKYMSVTDNPDYSNNVDVQAFKKGKIANKKLTMKFFYALHIINIHLSID